MKQKLLNILKSTGVLILMLLWPSVIFIIFNVDINNITSKDYVNKKAPYRKK